MQDRIERALIERLLRLPEKVAAPLAKLTFDQARAVDGSRSLDPRLQVMLALGEFTKKPGLTAGGPDASRRRYHKTTRLLDEWPDSPCMTRSGTLGLEGRRLRVRAFHPRGFSEVLPVVLYFHGGGFVIGDLDTHASVCHRLATASQCVVVSVDYRLGPEDPFPAAVEDVVDSIRSVEVLAERFVFDANRLGTAGDSAGGNLAFLAAHGNPDRVIAQLLYYPVISGILGMSLPNPSRVRLGSGYGLETQDVAFFEEHYSKGIGADPRIHLHLLDELGRAPKTRMLIAGFDPLRDEAVVFAEMLRERGVQLEHLEHEAWLHGYLHMGVMPEVRRSIHQDGLWLGIALRH